jgi:molybdopterin/thiamine biosynthesis adenylyltransferase
MAKKESAIVKKPLKIKVVGTGGIGLCLLPVLCRYLNYSTEKFPDVQISLIDGDHFEERNRERQDFVEVGPKASMTAAKYKGEYPRLLIQDHPVYVADYNVIQLIREGDIVLLCVDNHNTRKLISDRAEELNNVIVISGGNDLTDGNVLVNIRRDGKNVTLPLTSGFHPEIANPTDKHPDDVVEAQGCQVVAVAEPQLLFMNNLIAANMLAFLYNVLEEKQFEKILSAPEHWHELLVDMKGNKGPKAVVRERKAN